jgi:hypothetical protein
VQQAQGLWAVLLRKEQLPSVTAREVRRVSQAVQARPAGARAAEAVVESMNRSRKIFSCKSERARPAGRITRQTLLAT